MATEPATSSEGRAACVHCGLGLRDREVRFCCAGCIGGVESDKAGYFKKIDQLIVEDQLRYRVQIACCGWTALQWRMLSGRPTIIIEEPDLYGDHWRTGFLQPWVHYIPSTLEELPMRVEALLNACATGSELGTRGRARMMALGKDGAYLWASALMRQYQELFQR